MSQFRNLVEKVLKENDYNGIIQDIEDAQKIMYSAGRKDDYVKIINKYLAPVNSNISELTWTGDFIDKVGLDNAKLAVEELYKDSNEIRQSNDEKHDLALQKINNDLVQLNNWIDELNKYGEVRIQDLSDRKQLENYCYSDEGFEKCEFDPNDLRFEDDLIYLA